MFIHQVSPALGLRRALHSFSGAHPRHEGRASNISDERRNEAEESRAILSTPRRILVTGYGDIAQQVIRAANEAQTQVVVAVRDNGKSRKADNEGVKFVHLPSDSMDRSETWKRVLGENEIDGGVVHTIGIPTGPRQLLQKTNVDIADAVAQGLMGHDANQTFVQASSLASLLKQNGIVNCDYSATKLESENRLVEAVDNLAIVRIPLCVAEFEPTGKDGEHYFGDNHEYGMEQLARLPLPYFPLIGHGEQPIPYASVKQVGKALFRGLSLKGRITVNAVADIATQKQMAAAYQKMVGTNKSYRFVEPKYLLNIAVRVGRGHLQPYAINGLVDVSQVTVEQMASFMGGPNYFEMFKQVLGTSPRTLEDILTPPEGTRRVIYRKPPVIEHFAKGVKASIKHPRLLLDAFNAFVR